MNVSLGTFEGKDIQGSVLKFSEKMTDLVGRFDEDETVFLIVRGKVADISHGRVKGALIRTQKIAVEHAVVVNDTGKGSLVLAEAIEDAELRFGKASLFNGSDDE